MIPYLFYSPSSSNNDDHGSVDIGHYHAVRYGVSSISVEGRSRIQSGMKSFLYGKYGSDIPHPVNYANHLISDMESGDYETYDRFGTLDQVRSAWESGDYDKLADLYIRMYEADYKEYLTVEIPEKIREQQQTATEQVTEFVPGKWLIGGAIAAGGLSLIVIILILITGKRGEKKK
jgi:hypothetical protein